MISYYIEVSAQMSRLLLALKTSMEHILRQRKLKNSQIEQLNTFILRIERVRLAFRSVYARAEITDDDRNIEFLHAQVVLREELNLLLSNKNFHEMTSMVPFSPPKNRKLDLSLLESLFPDLFQGARITVAFAANELASLPTRLRQAEHPAQDQSDFARLRKIVPPQKIAPVVFDIKDGRLVLVRSEKKTINRDTKDVAAVRDLITEKR
jgi:hypothetical protein